MDNLRGRDTASDQDDFDYAGEDQAIEAPPEIGRDERRMHVRAYNFWASLLGDQALPSIEDLDPAGLEDFGPNSVLLDLTAGVDDPVVSFLGEALREECGIDGQIEHISDIPARSLLSRLTDHCLQIIANAAPIGFEAEFVNQRGIEIAYRGIMMPFSSDGETVDFVYGVINWKEIAGHDITDALMQEVDEALRSAPPPVNTRQVWADGPSAPDFDAAFPEEMALPEDADLADYLALARDSVRDADMVASRSRTALYRALGLAHDFALAAKAAPDDYAEMLDDAGITVRERSPMTALVKLVFGADYDKTRLAEYAMVLAHAEARAMPAGSLADHLEDHPGGIKGLLGDIRRERRAARPPAPDRYAIARSWMKAAPAMSADAVETDADGLVVLVARRGPDGELQIVAALPGDTQVMRDVVTVAAPR